MTTTDRDGSYDAVPNPQKHIFSCREGHAPCRCADTFPPPPQDKMAGLREVIADAAIVGGVDSNAAERVAAAVELAIRANFRIGSRRRFCSAAALDSHSRADCTLLHGHSGPHEARDGWRWA